jgi:hypothetical protein
MWRDEIGVGKEGAPLAADLDEIGAVARKVLRGTHSGGVPRQACDGGCGQSGGRRDRLEDRVDAARIERFRLDLSIADAAKERTGFDARSR